MENIRPSELKEICQECERRGNDANLELVICRDAEGTPYKAEIAAGGDTLFDLPVDIEPVLNDDTPAEAPNLDVLVVKSNILGWLNLAIRETARLNIPGRYSMADTVITEIQKTMDTVRKYVC